MTEPARLTATDFLRVVRERFPSEEHPDLHRDLSGAAQGLLHVQMGAFSGFTQRAIERGDFERVTACFAVIGVLMERPDEALLNALNVSFFENLKFRGKKGRHAWNLLPPAQQKAWLDMEAYLNALFAKT